jgi:hypothetical protein
MSKRNDDRWKMFLLATAALMGITPIPSNPIVPDAQAANNDHRGMWIWDVAGELIENRNGAQNTFFNFIAAPHGDTTFKLTHLYFEARDYNKDQKPFIIINDYLTTSNLQPLLRAFIKRAHGAGYQVEYLDGQALWTTSDELRQVPIDICKAIVDFNAGSAADEKFDGVHYDIEPHTLGRLWRSNSSGGTDRFNNTLQNNQVHILRSCKAMGLRVTNDTPRWLAREGTDMWNEYMKGDVMDYITILNYVDDNSAWIRSIEENLRLNTRKLPMVFGAETIPGGQLNTISFAQEGYSCMKNAFDTSGSQFATDTTYRGVAVHYYTPFSTMSMGSCQ